MQIQKPEQLSLTLQPLDWHGKLHQSFTVGLGFDLVTGALLPADVAWTNAMQGLAPGDCIDTGLPKKQPEWLLAGAVYTPAPMRGLVVQTLVGASHREWLISGEQQESTITPFTHMPLGWANTWGSPEHPDNPLGCGIVPGSNGKRRLPTVTDKNDTRRSPACPGPLGAWPCRLKNMGTYDAAWLKNRWPGVPDDFDWTFFNLAQPAQRLSRLQGGEHLVLTSLHPEHERLELDAPIHNLRVTLTRGADPTWHELTATRDTLWLFPNQLTGLFLWHSLTTCADEVASDITIIRLQLEPACAEAEAEAVVPPPPPPPAAAPSATAAALLAGGIVASVAAATAAMPKAKHAAPTEPETPSAQVAQAAPVVPAAQVAQVAQAVPAVPVAQVAPAVAGARAAEALQSLDDSLNEINAGLLETGLPPLTPAQLAATRERILTVSNQIDAALAQQAEDDPIAVLRQAGVPEERIEAAMRVLDLAMPDPADFATQAAWEGAVEAYIAQFSALMQPSEAVVHTMRTVLGAQGPDGKAKLEAQFGSEPDAKTVLVEKGVDPVLASRLLDKLEHDTIPSMNEYSALMAYTEELERELGFPTGSVSGRIKDVHTALVEAGIAPQDTPASKTTAKTTPPASEAVPTAPTAPVNTPPPPSAATPQPLSARPQKREEVAIALLLGLPLAGVCFAGLDLSGLDFSDRDLQQAVFDGAKLDNADFSRSDVTGGSFKGASLQEASFQNTKLNGASFAKATAQDADFTAATLTSACFAGANLYGATFHEASATKMDASNAILTRARLHFCDLQGSDLSGTTCNRTDFHAAALGETSFVNADLTNASLGTTTSATGINCTGATLTGSTWHQVDCTGGVFTGVKADGASFTDCDLSASSWRAATARQADFSRSTLHHADLRGANLFKASLRETRVETCNLDGASLYGADLYRLGVGAETSMRGTDITATIMAARKEVV